MWKHIHWINNFTCSSINKIKEITLFINFNYLVTYCYQFFLEIYFKVFNHLPWKISKFWNVSYKKINFLLSFRNLSILYYILIILYIKFKYLALFWSNSCIIRSGIVVGSLSESKIFILINRFRILKTFLTISFYK